MQELSDHITKKGNAIGREENIKWKRDEWRAEVGERIGDPCNLFAHVKPILRKYIP